jgi:hypothetical protein
MNPKTLMFHLNLNYLMNLKTLMFHLNLNYLMFHYFLTEQKL